MIPDGGTATEPAAADASMEFPAKVAHPPGSRGFPTRLAPGIFAILAGLAGALSFARGGWGLLAWVSAALLAGVIARARSGAAAFLLGFLAGMTQSVCNLSWIPPVLREFGSLPFWGAWATFLLMSGILSLFPASAFLTTRFAMNRRGEGHLFLWPVCWVSGEWLLSHFPFGGFPWLLTAYSQTAFLRLIQVSDLAGPYAVSFLVHLAGASLAWLLLRRRGARAWVPLACSLIALAACTAYGSAALRRWREAKPTHTAAMIQSNLSVREEWPALRWKYSEGYARGAEELQRLHPDLLILPESPSPLVYEEDAHFREVIGGMARRFPLGMIFNNIRYGALGEGGGYFNTAYFLDGSARLLGRYDKMRLVPFGEYIPWQRLFAFADPITKDVSSFTPGSIPLAVPMGPGRVSVMICYEAVFPAIARRFTLSGSQLLVNLSNDAWYGESAAPGHHLAVARWRAIENRRYLLRATNSGISACISASGELSGTTRLFESVSNVVGFAFLAERSLYSRVGDWFPAACAIILGCAVGWALKPLRLKRRRGP